jgi:phage terminase small subunit
VTKKLNEKQAMFAKEYIKDYNATQAAIRAGYSEKTAGAQAHKLLKNAEIMQLVAGAMEERNERVKYDADQLLADILRMKERVERDIETLGAADPQMVNAFARLTDQLGKHVDVQAWKERIEHTVVDHASIMEKAIARVESANRSKRLH